MLPVNESSAAVVIAEVAVEHLGSRNLAIRCIEQAAAAGCDYVKFQHHIPDKEMVPDKIQFWGGSLDDILARYNLTLDDHKALKLACEANNIGYMCTPFSREAALELIEIGLTTIKLGSGEMDDWTILDLLVSRRIEMIISTGMSSLAEVDAVYSSLKELGASFAFLNCTSAYPTRMPDTRLKRLSTLLKRYPDVTIGQSDHSDSIYSALYAAALGAKIIEKHFTIDKRLKGPDWEVSIEPDDMKILCTSIKELHKSASNDYPEISGVERETRKWAKHGVYLKQDVEAGSLITMDKLIALRPVSDKSFSASQIPTLIGKTLAVDKLEGQPLNHSDVL